MPSIIRFLSIGRRPFPTLITKREICRKRNAPSSEAVALPIFPELREEEIAE